MRSPASQKQATKGQNGPSSQEQATEEKSDPSSQMQASEKQSGPSSQVERKRQQPLWTDTWQTGVAVFGASIAIIFGIFSVLQWQVAEQGKAQANVANLFALLQYCSLDSVSFL
jgi:hypothetical protein